MLHSISARFIGSFIGLAIGDAMGAPVEFQQPKRQAEQYSKDMGSEPLFLSPLVQGYQQGGAHQVRIAEWTDDTAMACAIAESLLQQGSYDPRAIMSEWSHWYRTGKHGTRGYCFDIGLATSAALRRFIETDQASPETCGSVGPNAAGNGGIMRLAPAVIFQQGNHPSRERAINLAEKQSRLTHGEQICDTYARILGGVIWDLATAETNLEWDTIIAREFDQLGQLKLSNSGYVKTTYEAALWAIATSQTFEEAILKAVNLGGDADTIGAVTGQIAGARWGYQSIPEDWRANLVRHDHLYQLAHRLYDQP